MLFDCFDQNGEVVKPNYFDLGLRLGVGLVVARLKGLAVDKHFAAWCKACCGDTSVAHRYILLGCGLRHAVDAVGKVNFFHTPERRKIAAIATEITIITPRVMASPVQPFSCHDIAAAVP